MFSRKVFIFSIFFQLNFVWWVSCEPIVVNFHEYCKDIELSPFQCNDLNFTSPEGITFTTDRPSSTKYLHLRHSDLETLPLNLFGAFPQLKYINVYKCIRSLNGEVFRDGENLETAIITHTEIEVLPSRTFESLRNLKVLDFADSSISELQSDSFWGLSNLEYLQFSDNQLKSLPKSIFDPLTSIETISLSYNKLSSLDDAIFQNNKRLKNLHLNGNRLKAFRNYEIAFNQFHISNNPLQVLELGSASFLSTGNCQLETLQVPAETQSLVAPGNRIEQIAFDKISNLKHLDLSYNLINHLNFIKDAINLKFLRIDGNPIRNLDLDVFDNTKELQVLNISLTRLDEVDINIFKRLNVNSLYIKNAGLTPRQCHELRSKKNLVAFTC